MHRTVSALFTPEPLCAVLHKHRRNDCTAKVQQISHPAKQNNDYFWWFAKIRVLLLPN